MASQEYSQLLNAAIKRNTTRMLQCGHDGRSMKAQLFKDEDEKQFTAISDGKMTQHVLSGSSYSEAASSFSTSVGVQASYGPLFEASLQTEFSQHGCTQRTTRFVKRSEVWKVGDILRKGAGIPTNVLLPQAKVDIDKMDPEQFLDIYGTFYVTHISLGGKIDTYLSTESSKETCDADLQIDADVSGSKGLIAGGVTANVQAKSSSVLKNEKLTASREVVGGDMSRWKSDGFEAWKKSTSTKFDVISFRLSPIWYLCSSSSRQSALKQAAFKLANQQNEQTARGKAATQQNMVKHGDVVYIKVDAPNKDLWLSKQRKVETYCAMAGPKKERAKFVVEKGVYDDEKRGELEYIRLIYKDSDSYLGSTYKCLYAATTGSTKYDERSDNTKQMWVLDSYGNTDLKYDATVQLMDLYVFSFMAVNLTASAKKYGASSKVWVEAKYARHMLKNFCNNFIFERA